MRVALIHEWLTNRAGSEKVVASLRDAFPGSPVCTTMRWLPAFPDWDQVRTSVLQPLARSSSAHIAALPAMPAAWRAMRLPPADLYLTSFHTFALHARVPTDAAHLVYCHTPPRFIWARGQLGGEGGRSRQLAFGSAAALLGSIDRRRARRPTSFVANSSAVRERIAKAYGVDARVVHPPVDVARFTAASGQPKEDYYLFLSRLVPYKRPDLAVEAFAALGLPLVVAGDGRAAEGLRSRAPANVRFVGHVPDDELPSLVARARGLVFPGEEDFGISLVEAMAAGTPVIAYGAGGALDTVVDGVSGILIPEQSSRALADGVRRAAATDWDTAAVSATASRFGPERFASEMQALAAEVTAA